MFSSAEMYVNKPVIGCFLQGQTVTFPSFAIKELESRRENSLASKRNFVIFDAFESTN